MKTFKGKAIYNPSGKAGEYSYWACNFYVGCSNGCEYCYCKKGILAGAMGGDTPKLKACFKDENHALDVFKKELKANLPELQKNGIFFTFTSDPFLPETIDLTGNAHAICARNKIPVKFLTKKAGEWVDNIIQRQQWYNDMKNKGYYVQDGLKWGMCNPEEYNSIPFTAFGFTLTGHDELEPNASTNVERISAMRKLHEAGFKTWASIEPVITYPAVITMIEQTREFCDLYKIGLMSGKKYDRDNLNRFITAIFDNTAGIPAKIYFKDSLLKQAGIDREYLPDNCVGRDYNMF